MHAWPFTTFTNWTARPRRRPTASAAIWCCVTRGLSRSRKVLNVDEKKPRIALGVVHPLLSTQNTDEFNKQLGLAGLKKALTVRGYETRDIILKKWGNGPPQPAVLTFGENRFEQLESKIAGLENTISSAPKHCANWKRKRSSGPKAANRKQTRASISALPLSKVATGLFL